MKHIIDTTLSDTRLIPLAMAIISAGALGLALMAQYIFGLEPCVLCVIQRYPYGIIIALGLLGFVFSWKYNKATTLSLALIGICFLANSLIAFYHSGVELHWWKSFLEGCAVPEMKGNMDQILADIQSRTKAVRCDEIPWADPIFGLSMANYNVLFCATLAILAGLSVKKNLL